MIDIIHDPIVEVTAYAFRVRDICQSKYTSCTPRRRRWALMTDDEQCPRAARHGDILLLRYI